MNLWLVYAAGAVSIVLYMFWLEVGSRFFTNRKRKRLKKKLEFYRVESIELQRQIDVLTERVEQMLYEPEPANWRKDLRK